MKKLTIFAFLGLSALAFSQDVKNSPDKRKQETALIVPTEQKELVAKKKAAEEKAKLPKPYNPKADAEADINKLVAKAKKEGKNVTVMGNNDNGIFKINQKFFKPSNCLNIKSIGWFVKKKNIGFTKCFVL